MSTVPKAHGEVELVVLAVPTYRRNVELMGLLPRLLEQCTRVPNRVQILVIDNDPEGGARTLISTIGPPVSYVHEPRPGIAAVRNRALAEAGEAADILVFIDDDEVPAEGWLSQLLGLYDARRPSAVVGPVISTFAGPSPDFVTAGAFFERLRWPSGTSVTTAATNNLLLDLGAVRQWDLHFDERFGLTGGSDTLFCLQLIKSGGSIVWCDEAVVFDEVPQSRNTREWVTQRAYRSGNTWSRASLAVADSWLSRELTRVRLIGRGAVRVAGGATRFVWGKVSGELSHEARGIRTLQRGSGMLAGAFNVIYAEYSRPAIA